MIFLDISPIDPDAGGPLVSDLSTDSVVFDVNRTVAGTWEVADRSTYDNFSANDQSIELQKRDSNGVWVVVDRIDPPNELGDSDRDSFATAVRELEDDKPDDTPPLPNGGPGVEYPAGWKICGNTPGICNLDHWAQWVRVTRAWGAHVPDGLDPNNAFYTNNEFNPRYIAADRVVTSSRPKTTNSRDESNGDTYVVGDDPDVGWISEQYYRVDTLIPTLANHKPTFFDMNNGWFTGYPDKGWYGFHTGTTLLDPDEDPVALGATVRLDYSLQMMQKDSNFDQVGELLNVWLFTHELTGGLSFNPIIGMVEFVLDASDAGHGGTLTTFSEFMSVENEDLVGQGRRINRLIMDPEDGGSEELGEVIGQWTLPLNAFDTIYNYKLMFPALPAGVRVLDAFVCDGQGVVEDYDGDGVVDVGNDITDIGFIISQPEGDVSDRVTHYLQNRRFLNANGFSGAGTPGLININTAPARK